MTTNEILRTASYLATVIFFYNALAYFGVDRAIGEHVFRSLVFGLSIFPFYWGGKLLLTLYCTIACSLEDKMGDVFWLPGMEAFYRKFQWKSETNDQ